MKHTFVMASEYVKLTLNKLKNNILQYLQIVEQCLVLFLCKIL